MPRPGVNWAFWPKRPETPPRPSIVGNGPWETIPDHVPSMVHLARLCQETGQLEMAKELYTRIQPGANRAMASAGIDQASPIQVDRGCYDHQAKTQDFS